MHGIHWLLPLALLRFGLPALGLAHVQDETPEPDKDKAKIALIRERASGLIEPLVQAGVPGVSVALVLPSGQTLALSAGQADVAAGTAMTPDMRLLSGSAGKTYLIGVVLHLLAQGKLDLEREARTYFEGEDLEFVKSLPGGGRYSLNQLLRHQSGLPRYVFDPAFNRAMVAEPDRVWTAQDRLAYVVGMDAQFEAGSAWAYSDTNYILAGMIVETVAGKTFYQLARELLLEPLKLADTLPTDERRIEKMSQGYVVAAKSMGVDDLTLVDGQFHFNVQFEWCGGGWASTPLDLARWLAVLYGGELLEDDYLDAILDAVPAPMLGQGTSYGLGVMLREGELGQLRYHDGFMPGYLTTAGFFADIGVSAAIQTNIDDARLLGRRPVALLEELVAIVAEELEL
ncbi:MAG: D-alanyl-D-alanine carboxypeptidase [Planctomycetota bacterium]|jgi:D-alanyl-D-alanine carboxypeptidase